MEYYNKPIDEIYKILDTSEKGLSSSEAKARLDKYGYNVIQSKKKISPLVLFFQQFNDPVVWVLMAAALISALLGEIVDFWVILAILIANSIIGFVQEYNAEKAIEALKKLASLKAVVIRDGEQQEIDAKELVPGDLVLLSAGEKVPADARLVSLNNLQVQEAALTGESVPVEKEIAYYNKKLEIGDRKNMVFSGTVITGGKASAIVVRTGMDSEIGKIAKLIESTENELTPLQKKLEKLGKFLTILTLGICAVIFLVLYMRQGHVLDALITAVSLAVAAIPEGLPAVVTISLALGVQRMIKKNALIRKLPSVETLGSTTVICTDKTGTLTRNEMTVKKIYIDNKVIDVSGSGYEPEGTFSEHPEDLDLLLKIGMLNNSAKLEKAKSGYKIIGDPTEGALIVAGEKSGFRHTALIEEYPIVDEILFDSSRKRMTTVHKAGKKRLAYVKGAPDVILGLCSRIIINGKIRKLTKEDKKNILSANEMFAENALRVLGFAYKELAKGEKKQDYEKDLVFVGLQGMIDPPREEAKEAILKCKTAGIKVVMITGDYKGTAVAIAKELGIEGKALSGAELDKIKLDKEVDNIGVYARVNPEHKMRIVEALKKKGHIVAMTGDGVNDAPALKAADIGISMGITGTDVAKEASDMILTDDNFASIVNAVEEGRGIFDNIKKFIQYLLSSNLGEILVIFAATLLSLPLPLIPTQILWMNLLTDGLPAVALGLDPGAKDIMKRKPRKTDEGILTRAFGIKVFYTGFLIAFATLSMFWHTLKRGNYFASPSEEVILHARTIAFTTLVVLQFVRLHIIRSEYKLGFFSNMKLVMAIGLSFVLQLAVIYTRLGRLFETVTLSSLDWMYLLGMCTGLYLLSLVINKIMALFNITGD